MPSLTPPFSLRIPETLLNKIRFVANKNKRSANKEIEYLIEQYIEEYERKHGAIKVEE
ncbi:MAG TPA: Arc family DNA-binding protein [Selenomonadales bacterium]|nr:Arc family DNA-binding protein [Selenomonadales bacterium]